MPLGVGPPTLPHAPRPPIPKPSGTTAWSRTLWCRHLISTLLNQVAPGLWHEGPPLLLGLSGLGRSHLLGAPRGGTAAALCQLIPAALPSGQWHRWQTSSVHPKASPGNSARPLVEGFCVRRLVCGGSGGGRGVKVSCA